MGSLLDESVKIGATRIDNISLTATDEAIADAQKLALQKATTDAQAQAEAVFKSLNLTSKGIVTIQINGANIPQPMLMQASQAFARSEATTPVVGGEQKVTGSVTLQIRY